MPRPALSRPAAPLTAPSCRTLPLSVPPPPRPAPATKQTRVGLSAHIFFGKDREHSKPQSHSQQVRSIEQLRLNSRKRITAPIPNAAHPLSSIKRWDYTSKQQSLPHPLSSIKRWDYTIPDTTVQPSTTAKVTKKRVILRHYA
ncbi:MAG: hypothetical protein LBQ31_09445 [Bacteroidales bacterium]|nr:hypothetical protein [Bacteroidales bacterium]